MDDPYSSPLTQSPVVHDAAGNDPRAPRRIVFRWERLRVSFNALVLFGCLAIAILGWQPLGIPRISGLVFAIFLGANIAFFVGPLVELYLTAIHFTDDFSAGRRILFGAGILATLIVLVAVAFIVAFHPEAFF